MKFVKTECCNLSRVGGKSFNNLLSEYHTYKGKYFRTLPTLQ